MCSLLNDDILTYNIIREGCNFAYTQTKTAITLSFAFGE